MKAKDKKYILKAREQYQKDGEIEIDDNAVVSRGDPDGAYVAAWVFVYKPEKPTRKQSPGNK